VLDQLVYLSLSNIPLLSPLDVADILEVSAQNNAQNRLTGALTYSGNRFVQLLEGPQPALDQLLDQLRRDVRHRDMEILGRVRIRERAFPEWSMLFPRFTPATAKALAALIADGRRQAPAYRDLLQKMTREQTRSLGGL